MRQVQVRQKNRKCRRYGAVGEERKHLEERNSERATLKKKIQKEIVKMDK